MTNELVLLEWAIVDAMIKFADAKNQGGNSDYVVLYYSAEFKLAESEDDYDASVTIKLHDDMTGCYVIGRFHEVFIARNYHSYNNLSLIENELRGSFLENFMTLLEMLQEH